MADKRQKVGFKRRLAGFGKGGKRLVDGAVPAAETSSQCSGER